MEQAKDYYRRDYANEREFMNAIKDLPSDEKEKQINMRRWYLTEKIGTRLAIVKVLCTLIAVCGAAFVLLMLLG